MAHSRRHRRPRSGSYLTRVGVFVLSCTGALTLSFVGLVAFATGNTPGVIDRVPYYVLGTATVFVAAIVLLEQRRRDGHSVLATAAVAGAVSLVFLTLGGEGLGYALRSPSEAFAAQQFPYLVAAGLIGTGIGYWGTQHRDDVVRMLR